MPCGARLGGYVTVGCVNVCGRALLACQLLLLVIVTVGCVNVCGRALLARQLLLLVNVAVGCVNVCGRALLACQLLLLVIYTFSESDHKWQRVADPGRALRVGLVCCAV